MLKSYDNLSSYSVRCIIGKSLLRFSLNAPLMSCFLLPRIPTQCSLRSNDL